MIHKFTTQIPSVRRTPDSEVERARQRVVMDHSGSTRLQTTKPRDLPLIPARDVKERFRGQRVIVLEGYVIDVGAFAPEHPGGESLLRAGYGGRDLSEGFWKLNRHTRHARGLVEDMRIAWVLD